MKCEMCGQEATHRFSPDLDIDGLGGCDKHKESVQIAYFILINEGMEAFQSFLKSLQKKEKLLPFPPTAENIPNIEAEIGKRGK